MRISNIQCYSNLKPELYLLFVLPCCDSDNLIGAKSFRFIGQLYIL